MVARMIRVLVMGIAVLVACSSSKTPTKPDAPMVDAFSSTCGHPGDTGNELGIGFFCETLSDCSNTPAAHLCSSFGDPTTHFCTKTCTSGGSADQCGTNTTCECNASNQCGCTPNSCIM